MCLFFSVKSIRTRKVAYEGWRCGGEGLGKVNGLRGAKWGTV